jgi:hypothetical protein
VAKARKQLRVEILARLAMSDELGMVILDCAAGVSYFGLCVLSEWYAFWRTYWAA